MEKELEKILLKNEKLEKVFKNIIEEIEIFFHRIVDLSKKQIK